MKIAEEVHYQFNVYPTTDQVAEHIMKMAEGSTAEVFGEIDGAYLRKFFPTSYALAKKTGLIDLEITCIGGTSVAEEIKRAIEMIADESGVDEIMVYSGGAKIVHLYFYPKEADDAS